MGQESTCAVQDSRVLDILPGGSPTRTVRPLAEHAFVLGSKDRHVSRYAGNEFRDLQHIALVDGNACDDGSSVLK